MKIHFFNIFNCFRIVSTLLFMCLVGSIFYRFITDTIGLEIVMLLPVSAVLFFIALLVPSKLQSTYYEEIEMNFLQILLGLLVSFLLILTINLIRNVSPVKYKVIYQDEESLSIEFRQNNTFKVLESSMVGADITYGNYEEIDSVIYLKSTIMFGRSELMDTLILTDKGLRFKLRDPWRQTVDGIFAI